MEKIAIVILNWNTTSDTIECLNSLKKQAFKKFKVYLVDNGSNTGQIELLKTNLKKKELKIETFFNKDNIGFAGGNNTALYKAIAHEYVFLLNNDTTLDKNCLNELIRTIESRNNIGAISPKMYYYSNKKIIWAAGVNYNPILGKATLRGFNQVDIGQFDKSEQVPELVGAGILLKSSTLKKSGLFDEDYFCYYEETDLLERIKKQGNILWYEPKAIIYHKVAMSSGGKENPITIYYLVRNRWRFITKNVKPVFKLTGYLSVCAEIFLRLIKYVIKADFKKIHAVRQAIVDIVLGKKGKISTSLK